jgi:GNAT superfamily N-acetyltransferase
VIRRPDGRWFVRPEEVGLEFDRDVYVDVDEDDDRARVRCEERGFVVNRREGKYLVPTAVPSALPVPSGLAIVRADEVDPERLRRLDDALRQDVPGTDGWQWDEPGFRSELESSSFDPATYLVAVDRRNDEYVAIVRVWNNPSGPRLGFVGVLRDYRRRGLARMLVARVFAVLADRGQAVVTTEIDDLNVASRSLLLVPGARRVGGTIELVRRARRSV